MSQSSSLIWHPGEILSREDLAVVPTPRQLIRTDRSRITRSCRRLLRRRFRHIGFVTDDAVSRGGMKTVDVLETRNERSTFRRTQNSHDKRIAPRADLWTEDHRLCISPLQAT